MAEPEQLIGQFETGSAVHQALLQLPAKGAEAVVWPFRGLTHRKLLTIGRCRSARSKR